MRSCLILAILLSGHAFGHGLEPSKVIARENVDGFIRIRLDAWNRYDKPQRFITEIWADKAHQVPVDYEASVPGVFQLGSMQKRRIVFKFKHEWDQVWICTLTAAEPGEKALNFSTRVCSKVMIWRD